MTSPAEHVLLGGYAAKQCPVRTHNNFAPLVPVPQWVPPTELQDLFDAGRQFSWLDVPAPTGAETAGPGPYAPGDIKVPPGSVAGNVTVFAVKVDAPLANMGFSWYVCHIRNACHGSTDAETYNSPVPVGQWVDLRF